MKIKSDTKEKFHVVTVLEPVLAANMTEGLAGSLLFYLGEPVKNVILNLGNVDTIDEASATSLAQIQQKFYDAGCSLVFCNLKPGVEEFLDKKELLEIMNVTPTESEAWDIVQMEEIERELYGGEN